MNNDKAYIFGLIVGGGIWKNPEDTFQIRLPFRLWGAADKNPRRASQIARDILRHVAPLFQNVYRINVGYEAGRKYWTVFCEGNASDLISDMHQYGIEAQGEIREKVSLKRLIPALSDTNLKKRFIAGLADTIGSTVLSHRRFNKNYPTVSFEFKGFNYELVCCVCHLLRDLGCAPDQVLWNHPNFHAGYDPYYKGWKKGTKLRVMLADYATYGAFAFSSRAESARENLEQRTAPVLSGSSHGKSLNISCSSVHPDENYYLLPEVIKGGHYIHWKHVCSVLGCPYAPIEQIKSLCLHADQYINPFPILTKDTSEKITDIINRDPMMISRNYTSQTMRIQELVNLHEQGSDQRIFSRGKAGYPLNVMLDAVAFVIASDCELKGNRIRGTRTGLIQEHLRIEPNLDVEIKIPDIFTPLIVQNGNRAALVGPYNPAVNRKLITQSLNSPCKLSVRPVTEEDLRNEEE